MLRDKDFTPSGLKVIGQWETDRDADNTELYKAIVKEVFGVTDVIVGHHIVFVREDKRDDGFTYQVVEEIPSGDALIFDHEIAKALWGPALYKTRLQNLAIEPVETRDQLLSQYFYAADRKGQRQREAQA